MSRTRSELISAVLDRVADDARPEAEQLVPTLYDELRSIASGIFKNQPQGHTLQPTILVHEAYLKLAGSHEARWKDRNHFLALAAKVMRELLADYARRRTAQKRGGGSGRVTLVEDVTPARDGIDLVVFHDVLAKLQSLNPRHAEIVEMRCLAGMGVQETADALGVSRRTVELDWRAARAWMRCELVEEAGP